MYTPREKLLEVQHYSPTLCLARKHPMRKHSLTHTEFIIMSSHFCLLTLMLLKGNKTRISGVPCSSSGHKLRAFVM